MWFGSVYKNKGGRLLAQPPTKDSIQYAQQINQLLSTPPRKRTQEVGQKANPKPVPSKQPPGNHPAPTTQHNTPYNQVSQASLNHSITPNKSTFHIQVEEAFCKQNSINRTLSMKHFICTWPPGTDNLQHG